MPNIEKMRIVLAGHGSRSADGIADFENFVALFRARYPRLKMQHGYLEFHKPTIEEAVEAALKESGSPLVVVPALLAAATHAKNDMPYILQQLKKRFPGEEIRFASVMDLHYRILDLCRQRIEEAEAEAAGFCRRSETCLVLVGRGSSDPDANGDIAKITRMLHEGMGFGASVVCYSGTASPLVSEGLRQASKLGFRRLLVLPYFLFNGLLVQRIYSAADDLARRMGDEIEIVKASYLGAHEALADVFAERAYEALNGEAKMNCALCKYRVPIVGYEAELHKPQIPHNVSNAIKFTYKPHPIEKESFDIIDKGLDWSLYPPEIQAVLKRLVHTTGDFAITEEIFISGGAVGIGINALLRCKRIVTDVTMVQAGLKRTLLEDLNIDTWCGVHENESSILAEREGLTRSAAGIRRAWSRFGNDLVLAIGDAPTAVMETVRLIKEQNWRPQLVIGLPVGFVGTRECKEALKSCFQVPRITNTGTRGGSPWAATVINALMIEALNKIASNEDLSDANV